MALAAWRMVWPGVKGHWTPLMVTVGMGRECRGEAVACHEGPRVG